MSSLIDIESAGGAGEEVWRELATRDFSKYFSSQELLTDSTYRALYYSLLDKLLRANYNLAIPDYSIDQAVQDGFLFLVKYLRGEGHSWNAKTCYLAAKGNHLDILEYLHVHRCPWDETTFIGGIEGSNIDEISECVKYAYDNDCPWDASVCAEAAKQGNLKTLDWLHFKWCPWNDEVYRKAAEHGHIKCLRYAYAYNIKGKSIICTAAALGGYLECLRFAFEEVRNENDSLVCRPSISTILDIVKSGRLDGVDYAIQHEFPLSDTACTIAAEKGHLEILQHLRAAGCPWDETVSEAAIAGGHLELLKWTVSEDCPWPYNSCILASQSDSLQMLQYVFELKGCKKESEMFWSPIANRNMEMVQYLVQQGFPLTKYLCSDAAGIGDLEILMYLRENGCPWSSDTCEEAASHKHLDCLKYAVENGCPLNERVFFSAFRPDNAPVIAYLLESDCPRTPVDEATAIKLLEQDRLKKNISYQEYDPANEEYKTQTSQWPRYSASKRPKSVLRFVGPKETGIASGNLYLPIVRYQSLYYSAEQTATKYCGKFYYYEPQSEVLLHL